MTNVGLPSAGLPTRFPFVWIRVFRGCVARELSSKPRSTLKAPTVPSLQLVVSIAAGQ